MNPIPCLAPDELDGITDLAPSDPKRLHAATCPRCSALVASYARFTTPGPEADATHVDAADTQLTQFLAREIGIPAPQAPTAPASSARKRHSLLDSLFNLVRRPAFALGAIAAVTLAVTFWPRPATHLPTDTVRGDAPSAPIVVREARLDAAGLRVTWSPVAGADAYEVRIYSAELTELARLNANGDTVLTVSPSALPFTPVPGQPLLVRVEARAGGAVIATAPPVPLAIAP